MNASTHQDRYGLPLSTDQAVAAEPRAALAAGHGLHRLRGRALAGVGRFGQTNGQHITDAARLEIREQFDLLALLINGAVGARSRRRQHARDRRFGVMPRGNEPALLLRPV